MRIPDDALIVVTARVSKEQRDFLARLGGGNVSEGIRRVADGQLRKPEDPLALLRVALNILERRPTA